MSHFPDWSVLSKLSPGAENVSHGSRSAVLGQSKSEDMSTASAQRSRTSSRDLPLTVAPHATSSLHQVQVRSYARAAHLGRRDQRIRRRFHLTSVRNSASS